MKHPTCRCGERTTMTLEIDGVEVHWCDAHRIEAETFRHRLPEARPVFRPLRRILAVQPGRIIWESA